MRDGGAQREERADDDALLWDCLKVVCDLGWLKTAPGNRFP